MEKPKLLDILVDKIRLKHYSKSTEKTYLYWCKSYILYHNKRHPKEMGRDEIEAFLTHLAVEKNVAPSTQNQAFNAILFLYREVLNVDVSSFNIQAFRAKERTRIPVILSIEEVTLNVKTRSDFRNKDLNLLLKYQLIDILKEPNSDHEIRSCKTFI